VTVIDKEGKTRNGRILKIMGYHGLERIDVESASAGDIVCITGIDALTFLTQFVIRKMLKHYHHCL
jgi:GTP-binding protein